MRSPPSTVIRPARDSLWSPLPQRLLGHLSGECSGGFLRGHAARARLGSPGHRLHSLAALWAAGEVLLIGTVSLIFWRGQRGHWQANGWAPAPPRSSSGTCRCWRRCWNFAAPSSERNWYLQVFDPGQDLPSSDVVTALCARSEPLAQQLLAMPGPTVRSSRVTPAGRAHTRRPGRITGGWRRASMRWCGACTRSAAGCSVSPRSARSRTC